MTMAVVEQQASERVPQSQHMPLGVGSLLGAALVMFSIAFVFGGLPAMWESMFGVSEAIATGRVPVINEFLSDALLIMTMIAVGVGLGYLLREMDRSSAQPGLRAGVLFGGLALLIVQI